MIGRDRGCEHALLLGGGNVRAAAAGGVPEVLRSADRPPYLPADQIRGRPFVHVDGAPVAASTTPSRRRRPTRVASWRYGDPHGFGLPGPIRDAGDHTLRWRYRDQLDWRLVMIGLREDTEDQHVAGYTPGRQAAGSRRFRDRYGMPFAAAPRERLVATGRACRAVVATRLAHPGREFAAQRAIAFAWFTTPLLLDDDAAIEAALAHVDGIDAAAVVAALDSPAVAEAYEADKAGRARRRRRDRLPGQGRRQRRQGPLHGSVGRARSERAPPRGGRLPAARGLRVCIANLDPTLGATSRRMTPPSCSRTFPTGSARRRSRSCSPATSSTPTAPAPRTPCSRSSRGSRDARSARRRRDLAGRLAARGRRPVS